MYCKHCGNQVENDSKFCSFCGGLIDQVGQMSHSTEQNPNLQTSEDVNIGNNSLFRKKLIKNDIGTLIAFGLIVGLQLFWYINNFLNQTNNTVNIDAFIFYILKPSYVFYWTAPIILALTCFGKIQRNILFVIGIAMFAFNLYLIYFKKI